MKNIKEEIINEEMAETNRKLITRKEAIKKTAYIAVSAATMMILLSSPKSAKAQAEGSPAPIPGW